MVTSDSRETDAEGKKRNLYNFVFVVCFFAASALAAFVLDQQFYSGLFLGVGLSRVKYLLVE